MSKGSTLGCVMISLALLAACSSSKKHAAVDGGMDAGGTGGMGGMSGAGGKGGKGGSGGTTTTTGTAGTAMMPMMITCSEDAGVGPITCGGQTCAAPTTFAMINPCVLPCCLMQGGKEVCGSRSTATMFPADCSVEAKPDPSCPEIAGAMGGAPYVGCCDSQSHTCGFISTARPGCRTSSTFVMLPNPPMMCSGGSDQDGGAADAGR